MLTPEACLELLDEAGCSEDIIDHSVSVAELADAMAARTAVDARIVRAGALLHDIGRAFDQGPDHVPLGVEFLREHGVDEPVVDCVARHMGAGIEPDEAAAFGWPEGVWAPQSMEEKIVCHADNLTKGSDHRAVDTLIERLQADDLESIIPRVRLLHEELAKALQQDPDQIAASLR